MREFQRKFFLLIPLSTAKRRRKPVCTASFPSYDGASLQHLASSSFRETDHRLSFGCRTGRAQGSLGYRASLSQNVPISDLERLAAYHAQGSE